jgi:hypothetical protein
MNQVPPPIQPEGGLFEGLHPGAILLGAVVDNLATLLSFTLLALWIASPDGLSENEEVAEAAFEAAMASPEFLIGSLILGLACTVLGAFVGARRAGTSHLRHGGWIAVASAALGLLPYLLPSGQPAPSFPLWYEVTGWLLLLPAGLAGGAIAASATDR